MRLQYIGCRIASIIITKRGNCHLKKSDGTIVDTGLHWQSITHIDLRDNHLTQLPALPRGLIDLFCSGNELTSLPKIPRGLKILDCGYNQLSSLPALPNSVEELHCEYNNLTALPKLPKNLKSLRCPDNQLRQLPKIRSNLVELWCWQNQLVTLPRLSVEDLHCDSNPFDFGVNPRGLPPTHNVPKTALDRYRKITLTMILIEMGCDYPIIEALNN